MSTEAKHTPGPLRVSSNNALRRACIYRGGKHIDRNFSIGSADSIADAELWASAPDVLQ